MPQLFYIGVKGLIENEAGEILVLEADISRHHSKDAKPYWDIPGGRIEAGENLLDTLRREIEEEIAVTELIGEPEHIATVISNHKVANSQDVADNLALVVYEVKISSQAEITLSEEHLSYEWVDRAEAARRLSNKYPKAFTDAL
jgi:8-oxo-dGTP pyrophosphatase MutT (NUDIX family)